MTDLDDIRWGVWYHGIYEYESEAEARHQLNLAQMDVPAYLVKKVDDGEWVYTD